MPTLTQSTRVAAVHTPLAENTLVFRSMVAREQLGRLYSIELEVVSEKGDIQPKELLGQTICIELKNLRSAGKKGGGTRYLHGYVNRFSQTARQKRYYHYQVTVVPWLWFLTRIADCRIFQQKTTSAILEDVFKKAGFSDFELRLSGHYEAREYCVQYRETDFNFVSRLMEQEGIYYYFEHKKDKHTLVIADSPSAHAAFDGYDSIKYRPHGGQHATDEEHVDNWASEQRHHTGAFAQTDYDFTRPRTPLATTESIPGESGYADFEVFDYPGDYVQTSQGQPWARARMEEIHVEEWRAAATADAKGLAVGYTFELESPPLAEEAGKYLAVSAITTMESGLYETGDASDDVFKVEFTAAKADTQYRPPRLTPRPVIQGVQTAVVTGPKGEEIYTDKYNRIKVQFFWDREGKMDENTTCFIRVGQVWAGKRWGATFIPRMGQEVIVSFLEGDPDRPIVVGSVYNGEQMPPYEGDGLDSKHKNDPNISGIKSLSTKGGQGFNEWRFDDTKGKEEIFTHAERNTDTRVKNDAMENIGHDRFLTVGAEKDGAKAGNQFEMVFKDKHLKVHHDQEEQIGNDQKLHVGGIDGGTGNQDIILDGTRKELIKKDDHLHVQGDRMQKIDKGTSLTVGGDQQEKVGKKHALDAGQEIHLKAGMKCIIEAGVQLTIKVGGNFVDIGPAGVTIVGTMVKINSGGAAGSGSGSSPAAPTDAAEAAPTLPTVADESQPGSLSTTTSSAPPVKPGAAAAPKVGGAPGMPSAPGVPSVPGVPGLSSLANVSPGFFNCVSNAAQKAGQAIDQGKKTVNDAKAAVKQVTEQVHKVENEVKEIVKEGEAVVKEVIADSEAVVKEVIQEGEAVVKEAIQEGEAVVNEAKDAIKEAETTVDDLKGAVQEASHAIDDLKQAASQRSIPDIRSAIQEGKNAVKKAEDAYKTAKDGVKKAEKVYDDAKKKAEKVYDDARKKVEAVYGDVKKKAEKAYDNAKKVVDKAENTVKEAVDDVKKDIETAKNLVEDVKTTVKAAGDALEAAEQCV